MPTIDQTLVGAARYEVFIIQIHQININLWFRFLTAALALFDSRLKNARNDNLIH